MNPVSSGISDYSEELLPYLGQAVEIDLFVDRGVVPTNADLVRSLTVLPLTSLPERHAARPYDAVVYHMGNSPAHAGIAAMLERLPGVVVLHDWLLHHLQLGRYAAANDLVGYQRELTTRYGPAGTRAAARMLRGQLSDAVFSMPLNETVLSAARGIIGHSRFVVEQTRAQQPGLPSAVVPMGVPLPPLIAREVARAALGLGSEPIWASFGHINPYKRIEPALRAFRRFRADFPTAHYLLVGSVSPNFDLAAIIRQAGLVDAVTVTGYVPAADFNTYVAATDLCINLRYPTAGETSASLLRLLGAGRPTLVSAGDTFAELPDDVCAKVDSDRAETALIYHYAHLLHTAPALASAMGRNARDFVAHEHTLAGAAAGYLQFLAEVYGWPEPPAPVRPPLWNVEPAITAAPPLSHTGPTDITRQVAAVMTEPWFAGIGTALAELGVTASDDAPLIDVVRRLSDLLG